MPKITPLSIILRPTKISDIIGQQHLTDPGCIIYQMVAKGNFCNIILWGPPGTGKTSIARSIAFESNLNFCALDATKSTVKDFRNILSSAEKSLDCDKRTLVFIDDCHRWNKSQQDVMLPAVENGTVILIGATTEKPKFAINSALLSRCIILETKPLNANSMINLICKVKDYYNSLNRKIKFDHDAIKTLIIRCSGDARKMIIALETIIEILSDDDSVTLENVDHVVKEKSLIFDAHGNEHFDLAHCYQESIQHSDADAAIYWLAKWLESGEDPAYICRRMLITAFEDCASNPLAVSVAMAACYATERTGMPECAIPMALATCEMAKSKRDKSAYHAIKRALDDVRNGETVHVPPQLRAGTSGYFSAIKKQYVY